MAPSQPHLRLGYKALCVREGSLAEGYGNRDDSIPPPWTWVREGLAQHREVDVTRELVKHAPSESVVAMTQRVP